MSPQVYSAQSSLHSFHKTQHVIVMWSDSERGKLVATKYSLSLLCLLIKVCLTWAHICITLDSHLQRQFISFHFISLSIWRALINCKCKCIYMYMYMVLARLKFSLTELLEMWKKFVFSHKSIGVVMSHSVPWLILTGTLYICSADSIMYQMYIYMYTYMYVIYTLKVGEMLKLVKICCNWF
jgi:hypothetical protein